MLTYLPSAPFKARITAPAVKPLITAHCCRQLLALIAAIAATWLYSPTASADISATPLTPSLLAQWDTGDLQLQQGFCVDSAKGNGNGNGNGPPTSPPGTQRPYDVTLDTPGSVALTQGSYSLPVTLTWVDVINNRSYPLQPLVTSNRELDGIAPCDNARLLVAINEADLDTAFPGVYHRNFQISLSQDATKASPPNSITLNITVEVEIPDRVRISGLNDIFLGSFDGYNNLTATDQVCVFRASGGNYRVTLRGDGPANSFVLHGPQANDELTYRARWNDTNVEADTPLDGQTAGRFGGDTLCGGGSNASLNVQVDAADAILARAGDYRGVLTVIVEME